MNYQIHYTNQVKEDLKRALGYIKFTLKNPQAAQALLDEANQLIASLSQMPERYALVDDVLLAGWGLRFIRVKNYLAFYVVDEEAHTVHLIRFLYGRSDWRSALRSEKTDDS